MREAARWIEELCDDNVKRDRNFKSYNSILHDQEESVELHLSRRRSGRVLDIGFGEGRALDDMVNFFPRLSFFGIDVTPKYLSYGSFPATLADGQRLPFRDGSFDVVLSVLTFNYFADKFKGLEEVYRVLAPRGTAFIHVDPILLQPNCASFISPDRGEVIFWANEQMARIEKFGRNLPEFPEYELSYRGGKDAPRCWQPVVSIYQKSPHARRPLLSSPLES